MLASFLCLAWVTSIPCCHTHTLPQVTAVHKANIMKLADGMFLKVGGPSSLLISLHCLGLWGMKQHDQHMFRPWSTRQCRLGRRLVTAVPSCPMSCSRHQCLSVCCVLQACREVAPLFPTIKYEEMIVDNTCMQVWAQLSQVPADVM